MVRNKKKSKGSSAEKSAQPSIDPELTAANSYCKPNIQSDNTSDKALSQCSHDDNPPQSTSDGYMAKGTNNDNNTETILQSEAREDNWDVNESNTVSVQKSYDNEDSGRFNYGGSRRNENNSAKWDRNAEKNDRGSNRMMITSINSDGYNKKPNRKFESERSESRKSGPYGRNDRTSNFDRPKSDFRGDGKRDSSDRRNWNYRPKWKQEENDQEFQTYQRQFREMNGRITFSKVSEEQRDLFEMPEAYSLGHCVAEDMNMGSGIAVQFRYKFKRVPELLNQRQLTGGLAVLTDKDRFIYYLVTKKVSTGKPTYATLFASLKELRKHIQANGVTKLALPRIGCGLDRLEWENVKFMLEFICQEVDVQIIVCNLEMAGGSPQRHRNSKVTHVTTPIEDIEEGTVILYFSSIDGFISEEMQKLDEKFNFLNEFTNAKKALGEAIVYTKNQNFLLCGCIVRESKEDPFNFVALMQCLTSIQKTNKEYRIQYFAFQAIHDADNQCNYKIINILRNSLRDCEVYVCWPGELQNLMAPRDRSDANNSSWSNNSTFTGNDSKKSYESANSFSSNAWTSSWQKDDTATTGQTESNQKEFNDSWTNERDTTATDNNATTSKSVKKETEEKDDGDGHEYDRFRSDYKSKKIQCTSIQEKKMENFGNSSRLCYAKEDLMVQGGGPPGSDLKKEIGSLLSLNPKEGDLISFKDGDHYIYILIIKEASEAEEQKVFSSIQKLRKHIKANAVRKLVIPQFIPKKSRFDWSDLTQMYQFLLGEMKIEMILSTFAPEWDLASIKKRNNNKIAHSKSGLHQMKKNSIIIFCSSVDNHFSEEMKGLDKKFKFQSAYQREIRRMGQVFIHYGEDDILCGCVVKNSYQDNIDFELLQKCFERVNGENKTKNLKNVAIQAVYDEDDANTNSKIVTLLLYCLENVSITMCWPGNLRHQMLTVDS